MTRQWPIIRLGDLVDPKRGITYGIVQPGQHVSDGVPIVRVSDLKGDRVDLGNPMIVSREIEAAYSRTRLKGGELIMSIVGTVGQTAIVDQTLAGWNVARAVAVIPVLPEIGAYWIRLSLRGGLAKDHIDARLNTTVQATLNLKDLSNLPISVPPEGERNAISAILGALDDKIEMNRKMNATLEAMARALFRDWFVDFGPTRAKMEGCAPYLAQEIWDLFPDKLGEDGKPEGWESKPLGDFNLELESGRRPKGGIDKGLTGGVPSVGAESIYGVGRFDYSKVKFVSEEFGRSSSSGWVQAHDVAIYKDGANVGDANRVALFGCGFPFDKFMVNEHVFLLRSKELGQGFLYFLMQSYQISDRLEKLGTGKAAQPGLNQGEVKSCSFVFPGPAMCERFNNIVLPWMELALRNGKENQTLAQTRDLLLPRLMSGELRVADLDSKKVECA